MKHFFHAIIIGGGAAGLMCAVAAKKKNPDLSVAIIEKNDRVGKKLLATGNGRCNLTHDGIDPSRYVGSFRTPSRQLFGKIDTAALLSYFQDLGLLTSKDGEGRYYPLCRQASAVLDVLRFHCEARGVPLFCGEAIKSIRHQKQFTVTTAQNVFCCDRLVIAAGSKASPKLGGSNSVSDILKNLGHRFTPFSPALCPVRVQSPVLRSLKGLRAAAEVQLVRGGKTLRSERGEVQFNEDNLSGICVFNHSLHTGQGDVLTVDLLPDISEKELYNFLKKNQTHFAAQPADNLLTGILQKRTSQAALKTAQLRDFSRPCSSLSAHELHAAAAAAKSLAFPVLGNADFDRAQACTGGVAGSEIDPLTMHSRVCDNLSVCGEAIDLCGECGGYNLHFAFAGGIIAGEHL